MTPCVASQRVFIAVRVKCDPQFVIADLKEQCNYIMFCLKLGKTVSEMLKTASVMGRTQTFDWFSPFKHGKTLAEYCEHSCHPSRGHTAENVEKVHKIVNEV
jgi:hypothetical protein